jgi:hypothetical protein
MGVAHPPQIESSSGVMAGSNAHCMQLDQKKIDFAKRYFGVESEQEAIDRARSSKQFRINLKRTWLIG